jgi:hypothetical protein
MQTSLRWTEQYPVRQLGLWQKEFVKLARILDGPVFKYAGKNLVEGLHPAGSVKGKSLERR